MGMRVTWKKQLLLYVLCVIHVSPIHAKCEKAKTGLPLSCVGRERESDKVSVRERVSASSLCAFFSPFSVAEIDLSPLVISTLFLVASYSSCALLHPSLSVH